MTVKITTDILESYLQCRYKGHLKLVGERGTPSDYEQLMKVSREHVQRAARKNLLARYEGSEPLRNTTLKPAVLKQGISLILDSIVDNNELSVRVDALQRVPGPSRLGDFHYLPLLFHEAEHPSQKQRSLLELCGLILAPLQGREPDAGILIHGQGCEVNKIKLNLHNGQSRRMLKEIRSINSGAPPRLVLNRHCQICEFRERCYTEALAKDDLSLLRGMSQKEITKHHKRGIFTVTQLSCTFRPRKRRKQAQQKPQPHQAALQALGIREQKTHVYGTPELPTCATRIYFDLEGDPDRRFVYLLGMIVQIGESEDRYSFWADTRGEEPRLYQQFLDVVGRYDDFRLYSYGSYEAAFLRRMLKHTNKPEHGEQLLARLVNVLSIVYAHVYFPTYSNSLKDIARYLNFSWTEADASGIQSIVWRRKWERTRSSVLKEKLTTYNMEDCAALKKVTEFLFAICPSHPSANGGQITDHEGRKISRVEDIDPQWSRREWGTADFTIPDFEIINNCAYFDYQQDRVYIRTSKPLNRSRTHRLNKKGKKNLKANRFVEISSQTCRFCGGTELVRRQDGRLARLSYDLRISRSGIRRWITRFTTTWHWCMQCKKRFLPREYLNLDEHFHPLKSWAMYEHVAHRTSFSNIAEKISQYFGLPAHESDVSNFKQLLARYYAETYQQNLAKIVAGALIHADETEVHLKQVGKGYVWIFTNLEEVVFMYRKSRKGDFLHDLLKNFRGVLVSDFYRPYDALACEQQKCLIHLIRDFNHDIRSNLWDEELKALASDFGRLLRLIVATIDQYGLKQRHLNKHRRDVDSFYRTVSKRVYRSDVAEGYRKRLVTYQDKLFTFLCHDGVPWNNNNAEHAVKRFADYREIVDGQFTEVGLNRYLVLLSLYVTCKYKGISFLQFLLSREKDIDVFRQSGGRRRVQPTIELIPDGYKYGRRSRRRDWDQIPQQPFTDMKVELNTSEVRQVLAEKKLSLKRLTQKS